MKLRFFRVLAEWQVIYPSEITFHFKFFPRALHLFLVIKLPIGSALGVHKKQDWSWTKAFTVNPLQKAAYQIHSALTLASLLRSTFLLNLNVWVINELQPTTTTDSIRTKMKNMSTTVRSNKSNNLSSLSSPAHMDFPSRAEEIVVCSALLFEALFIVTGTWSQLFSSQ